MIIFMYKDTVLKHTFDLELAFVKMSMFDFDASLLEIQPSIMNKIKSSWNGMEWKSKIECSKIFRRYR